MRHGLDLRRLPDRLIVFKTTLRVDEVRGKDGVDEGALSQSSLPYDDYVELEAALQQLVLDLTSDRVEADVGGCANFVNSSGGHGREQVMGTVVEEKGGEEVVGLEQNESWDSLVFVPLFVSVATFSPPFPN